LDDLILNALEKIDRRPAAWRTAFITLLTCLLYMGTGLMTGCGGSSSSSPKPTPTAMPTTDIPNSGTGRVTAQPGWTQNNTAYQQNRKKWTFLVYMNGANNLEEYGSLNVNQMEQVGSTNNVNVVVQFKRIKGFDSSNGNWLDSRRYYVQKDADTKTINSLLLSSRSDSDMGKWQTLREFVDWGVTNYPADRYCLVIWNHGAGWRTAKLGTSRGISYDDATGNHIDTIEMPKAIDLAGLLGNGKKWDVLAFDASLMQMAEVSYEVRDKVQFITGSEESPPGEGYPYQLFLADLASSPDWSGRDFALDIVQKTIDGYNQNYPGRAPDITQSALDASKIGDIAPAVNDLGKALYNVRLSYSDAIIAARSDSESYAYPYYHDLLDFTRRLTEPFPGTTGAPVPDAAVQNAIIRVRQTVNAAVIKNVHGSDHPRATGLSIYLPSPAEFDNIDEEQANGWGQRYNKLAFSSAAPEWMNFLMNGPR
jgi:hypothetical protein